MLETVVFKGSDPPCGRQSVSDLTRDLAWEQMGTYLTIPDVNLSNTLSTTPAESSYTALDHRTNLRTPHEGQFAAVALDS